MAIALVTNVEASASGSQNVTTGSIDTTGANLIVIAACTYNLGSGPTVTDSKSNTWAPLTKYQLANATTLRLYYCENPTVGSGHTFTVSTSLDYPSVCVAAFSGVKTSSSFDVENGTANASSSTIATGSVTPSEDNELVITGFCFGNTGTASIDNGFTITGQKQYNSSVNMGGALAYKIQTTAAAVNPTWTISGSPFQLATGIATFKAAAAAAGQPIAKRFGGVEFAGRVIGNPAVRMW